MSTPLGGACSRFELAGNRERPGFGALILGQLDSALVTHVLLLGIAFVRSYAAIGSSRSARGVVSSASVATSTWRRSAPGSAELYSGLLSALVIIRSAIAIHSARTGSA